MMKAYSFKNPMLLYVGLLNDPSSVVRFLEVRVCETKEHLLDGPFPEIVCDVAHGVRSDDRDVVVFFIGRLGSKRGNLLAYEIDHLVSDLDAQTQFVREIGRQRNYRQLLTYIEGRQNHSRCQGSRHVCL